jgi:hypothetical protein
VDCASSEAASASDEALIAVDLLPNSHGPSLRPAPTAGIDSEAPTALDANSARVREIAVALRVLRLEIESQQARIAELSAKIPLA